MSADVFSPASFPRFYDADAEALRERERERGYADGHAEGFRAGVARALAEAERAELVRAEADAALRRDVASAVTALQVAADRLTARAREVTAASEREVSARAVELAELIVAVELSEPGIAAVAAVRRALAAHDADDVRSIRLSPDDVLTLDAQGGLPEGIPVTADAGLVPGDAIVVVDEGFVDARIGAALDRARHAVEDAALVDFAAGEMR
ncbi:FliH/SctL family protein [uncultured Microbacterium sp.]|uniref:FliH/SctL family protein n=1 Tax=uncultured Microbacterium sp. TaxID=191216 RepID=UPI00260AB86B|nr:FliH/SctL family protein [uncultured Microbacterium sp.]